IAGDALALNGRVVEADVLASHEQAVGFAVSVHIDATVRVLHDLRRNRQAVPRPHEAIVGTRTRGALTIENDPILVEALARAGVRAFILRTGPRGIGEVGGDQQTPATVAVECSEAACLRAVLAGDIPPFPVGAVAERESMRQIPRAKGV